MGSWWDDVKGAAIKYGWDYNPVNPMAAVNIGSDIKNKNFNPASTTTGAATLNSATGGSLGNLPDSLNGVVSALDPASPYKTLAGALGQASQDAKANAALQWQRQMAGLSRALGYGQQSQDLFNNVYGHQGPAQGATLPVGLSAPTGQSSGPGLQGYFGRGR